MPILPTDTNSTPNYTPTEHATHHNVLAGLNNELGNFVQATAAPGSPVVGDLWLDTDEVAQSGTSALLAYKSYRPGADAGTSISVGASYADIDATNLVVAFTAPASGKVLVRMSAYAESSVANLYFNLRDGSGDIANTVVFASQAGLSMQKTYTVVVTGLTPGASLSWKWGAKTASGTAAVYLGPTWGPAIMEVWAAP